MTKTVLEKMYAKPELAKAILHVPEELKSILLSDDTATELTSSYTFILAFYIKKEELKKELPHLKNALEEKGLLWIGYPKAKLLETNLNRDILHEILQKYNLDSVSIVSLNDTWSAMRFKKV